MSQRIQNVISVVVVIMIFSAFMGVIIAPSSFLRLSQSSTITTVPTNISLTSGNDARVLISVTNGSSTIPATNYTFYADADILQIDDNTSWNTLTYTITYEDASSSYVENATARALLVVMMIILIIGLIMTFIKKDKFR